MTSVTAQTAPHWGWLVKSLASSGTPRYYEIGLTLPSLSPINLLPETQVPLIPGRSFYENRHEPERAAPDTQSLSRGVRNRAVHELLEYRARSR